MVGWAVLAAAVVTCAPCAAYAGPLSFGVTSGPRFAMTSGETLVRATLTGARRWQGRWHTGLRAGFDASGQTSIYQASGELGIWLHASRSIDVVLGWRAGYARFHFGWVQVDALMFEPVADIVYRLSARSELRIAPFVPAAYRSDLWQVTFGADLGIAWRL